MYSSKVKWHNMIALKAAHDTLVEALSGFNHVIDQEIQADISGFSNLQGLYRLFRDIRDLREGLQDLKKTLPKF